jgi:hemerythrin superfamily protein
MEILRILSRMAKSDDHDALDVLRQDHAAVAGLFDRYEGLDDNDHEGKQALVLRVIRMLTVHGRIEEELFYPALRQAIGEQIVMEEAHLAHAMIRQLMADLYRPAADASHFDAKVRSLAQLVEHHVREEEGQMFQEARDSSLNLVAIGGQLDAYRAALESRYELDTDGEELAAFLSAPTVMGTAAPVSTYQYQPRRTSRSDETSAAEGNGKPGRRSKGISTSGRRRARRSTRPEAEASEGEST